MERSKNQAQESVEFILIVSLVFFAALMVMVLFGNKIATFFSNDSSATQTASNNTPVIDSNGPLKYEPDYETSIPYQTEVVGNYELRVCENGDKGVMLNNHLITLKKDLMDGYNQVFETAGTSGTENLLADLTYFCEKYNVSPTELDVWLGQSSLGVDVIRKKGSNEQNKQIYIQGVSDINMVCIRHGDKVLLVNKGQGVNDTVSGNFDSSLEIRLEGNISEDNTFIADKISTSSDNRFNSIGSDPQTYSTNVTIEDGKLIFENGRIDLRSSPFTITSDTGADNTFYNTGNLKMTFDNPNYQFSLNQ